MPTVLEVRSKSCGTTWSNSVSSFGWYFVPYVSWGFYVSD